MAGRLVMAALGNDLKPSTMELGGKSPSLVFEDADLDRAVPSITKALIQNSGQTCSAGSRLVVHRSRRDELVDRLVEALERVRLGVGLDDLDMVPVISGKQHAQVLSAIEAATGEGARAVTGGAKRPEVDVDGWFIRPTMLTGVNPSMVASRGSRNAFRTTAQWAVQ